MPRGTSLTGNERKMVEHQHIVSTTDPRGVITYANQDFVDISGYSNDELVTHGHNIVRHPAMPKVAFKMLWDRIESGKPWMGIVNNRCKNGDNYWVDAFVTPMLSSKGEIEGYQSVRVKPNAEAVKRADRLYQRINQGQAPISRLERGMNILSRYSLSFALPGLLVLAFCLFNSLLSFGSGLIAAMVIIGLSVMLATMLSASIRSLAASSKQTIDDPVAQWIYTGRCDELGQLQLANILLDHQQQTLIWRVSDSAQQLDNVAAQASSATEGVYTDMDSQQNEVEQVASAIGQMASSVEEVSSSVQQTVEQTSQADQQVRQGHQEVNDTIAQINLLAKEIDTASEVIASLAQESEQIGSFVTVIQGIAEQTNLLALNAAIEAARAGEQGRGFAVVADEVRTLASRTQSSTEEIQSIVATLQTGAERAVKVMQQGSKAAQGSVDQAAHAGDAIMQITQTVEEIRSRISQIANATEEQASVASEIGGNVSAISQQTQQTLQRCQHTSEANHLLAEQSGKLRAMVELFAR